MTLFPGIAYGVLFDCGVVCWFMLLTALLDVGCYGLLFRSFCFVFLLARGWDLFWCAV